MKNLVLQNATANWQFGENDNRWFIADPEGAVLFLLPKGVEDAEAMSIVHFARKYEKESYEKGVEAGKELITNTLQYDLQKMKTENRSLRVMNEQLADQLDRHISGD